MPIIKYIILSIAHFCVSYVLARPLIIIFAMLSWIFLSNINQHITPKYIYWPVITVSLIIFVTTFYFINIAISKALQKIFKLKLSKKHMVFAFVIPMLLGFGLAYIPSRIKNYRSCDISYARYGPKQTCDCLGVKVTIINDLEVDGMYKTSCVGVRKNVIYNVGDQQIDITK